jgi:hypothetical protein
MLVSDQMAIAVTTPSLIVASILNVSFWSDGNSSPGNYGRVFLLITLNLMYTPVPSLSFPVLHILQFTGTFCKSTCSAEAQFPSLPPYISKRATPFYEHTCSSSALCPTFPIFSPHSLRARAHFLFIFFYISHLLSLSLSLSRFVSDIPQFSALWYEQTCFFKLLGCVH